MDKNGKDIYEFDFVRVTNRKIETDIFEGKVTFANGEWLVGESSLYVFWKIGDSLEIIGNIYEERKP